MRFPSILQLWDSFTAVCKRFTLPIIYAVLGTVGSLLLTYNLNTHSTEQLVIKIIYLSNFGLALSFAVCLYAETKSLKKGKVIVANVLVLLLLLLIYFILNPTVYDADIIVLIVLGFAFHLLVAIAAFTSKEENNGFWQINKTFFLRFATAALYSTVLFAGLSIALLSIHTLFDIKWDSKIYFRLWIIIVGLFNTIFFLSDIKHPLKDLKFDTTYPKGLKVFTQYVLIPLSTIYLAILLAYEVKIIFQWSLPESSVAILILGYAVFGILSILLVHPIRNSDGNKWIHLYSKSFYLLMLPLLVLLAVAVTRRIMDYGVTESRYLLIVLGLWLSFITLYFLIRGREQIRIIPISLLIMSVLIVIGPWGIKSVSKKSQTKRLAHYIKEKPSQERDDEVRDLVKYLNRNYGSETLQPFVKVNLNDIEKKLRADTSKSKPSEWEIRYQLADTVLNALNVSKFRVDTFDDNNRKNYSNAADGVVDVKGAVKVVAFNTNLNMQEVKHIPFVIGKDSFTVKIDKESNLVLITGNQKITFNIHQILNNLAKSKVSKETAQSSLDIKTDNQLMCLTQNIGAYTIICRYEYINSYTEKFKNSKKVSINYNGYLIVYPNAH